MNNFWDEWKDISDLEKKAISSLLKAKELILKIIPKENIVAIYIKGSMIQRELSDKSDVDFVVILKDEKYLEELYKLNGDGKSYDTPVYNHNDTNSQSFDMPVQFVAYTLEELKTGKFLETRIKKPTPVSRFARHLESYKIIYGDPLNISEIFTRTDLQHLRSSIDIFNDFFIPDYESGKFKFPNLVKQVFWLTEDELRYKGIKPDYSWQGIVDSVNDQNHIIHQALELRRQKEYSSEEEKQFIVKLRHYLKELKEGLV